MKSRNTLRIHKYGKMWYYHWGTQSINSRIQKRILAVGNRSKKDSKKNNNDFFFMATT